MCILVTKDVDLLIQQWETIEARKSEQHSAFYSLKNVICKGEEKLCCKAMKKMGDNIRYGLLGADSTKMVGSYSGFILLK